MGSLGYFFFFPTDFFLPTVRSIRKNNKILIRLHLQRKGNKRKV